MISEPGGGPPNIFLISQPYSNQGMVDYPQQLLLPPPPGITVISEVAVELFDTWEKNYYMPNESRYGQL